MVWHLKLRQMEAFRAVILMGTVTRAAEALSITQPAVSRLIKDLEEQLGVDLFVRRQGRLQPTPEAEWLFDEAEETLSRFDRLDTAVRDIRNLQKRKLRIIATPPMAYGLMPDALAQFRQVNPEIVVSVQIAVRREVGRWTREQQFDLAAITLPIDYPDEKKVHLGKVSGVCVLPLGHPLAKKKAVTAADLEGEPFVTLLPEALARYKMDRLFEKLGIQRRITSETQTSSSVCAYVAAGLGVGIVDPFTAERFRPLGIEVTNFEPVFEFSYDVLYPIHKPRSKAAEQIVAILQQLVNENWSARANRNQAAV